MNNYMIKESQHGWFTNILTELFWQLFCDHTTTLPLYNHAQYLV